MPRRFYACLLSTDPFGSSHTATHADFTVQISPLRLPSTVSGTDAYTGLGTGPISVAAFDGSGCGNGNYTEVWIPGPGPYTLNLSPGTYYICACRDSNGNGTCPGDNESASGYDLNPVVSAGWSTCHRNRYFTPRPTSATRESSRHDRMGWNDSNRTFRRSFDLLSESSGLILRYMAASRRGATDARPIKLYATARLDMCRQVIRRDPSNRLATKDKSGCVDHLAVASDRHILRRAIAALTIIRQARPNGMSRDPYCNRSSRHGINHKRHCPRPKVTCRLLFFPAVYSIVSFKKLACISSPMISCSFPVFLDFLFQGCHGV